MRCKRWKTGIICHQKDTHTVSVRAKKKEFILGLGFKKVLEFDQRLGHGQTRSPSQRERWKQSIMFMLQCMRTPVQKCKHQKVKKSGWQLYSNYLQVPLVCFSGEDNFKSGYLISKLNLLLLSGLVNALVLIYVNLEKTESHWTCSEWLWRSILHQGILSLFFQYWLLFLLYLWQERNHL